MKKVQLPILICHANCPDCKLPTEFKMFESGSGGDFATYVGAKTKTMYRVDLGKVHYQGKQLDSLLAPAIKQEGTLARIPGEVRCKLCGRIFSATGSIGGDGEEIVDAYEL
jgi:hypothetical protein